jgi:hypothetical protein
MEYDYRLVYICNRINNIYAQLNPMSFGTVENISPLLLNFKLVTTQRLYFKWLVPFAMFASDNEHIAWLTWLLLFRVPLLYYFCFGLRRWFWKINLKNSCKSKRTKQLNWQQQRYCNLGSSFVGSLATYSDSFGLMLWKQKFTLWLLYSSPCFG